MSRRNSPEEKRRRRARRTLENDRLPKRINLVEWVQSHSSLSAGRARQVILAGSLYADGHPLGYVEVNGRRFLQPLVPAELRDHIQIITPKHLREEADAQ